MNKTRLAALGGLGAAVASALCCVGPLGAGFFWVSREDKKACEPGKPCASPEARRSMKRWLWIATAIGFVFGSFPWWSKFILS
jgi:hypothetical protein